MAAAAAATAAKALPYIEDAARAIGHIVKSSSEKRTQIKKLESEIDGLVQQIKAREQWFKDNGKALPKLGGADYNTKVIPMVSDVVERIVGAIQDRKLRNRKIPLSKPHTAPQLSRLPEQTVWRCAPYSC